MSTDDQHLDELARDQQKRGFNPQVEAARNAKKERQQKLKNRVIPQAPSKPQTTNLNLYLCIAGFVFCGTFSTVLSKVLFQNTSIGVDGKEHPFQKPLFQNMGMFVGMTLCLFVYEYQRWTTPRSEETIPLKADAATIQAASQPQRSDWRIYYIVLVPAVCDFVATYMMNIGLLWINASIWQMVRGSIIFFVALIRWGWLKRAIHVYQWFGVAIVMLALSIIGYACMNTGDASGTGSTETQKLLGVLLVFAAQLVQATQCVVEEHLLHDVSASASQVVGLEGFWGLLLCVGVAMPLASYLPIEGLHEDTWDSLVMLYNSPRLCALFIIYVFVILGFNAFAMKVTQYINSVTRNILDTIRTMFIWIILTGVHYTVSPLFGEAWSPWSLVELGGFMVLLAGLFTYYKVFTLPCFEYPDEEETLPHPVVGTPRTPMTPMSPHM